jgi:hypothetical protein
MEQGMKVLECSGRRLAWLFLAVGILALVPSSALSQRVLVEWNFPTNSADAVADGGTVTNLSRVISAEGGVGAVSYTFDGDTTKSARATSWLDGALTKYWMISLSSSNYSGLALSSKQRSSNTGPKNFTVQYRVGEEGIWEDIAGGAVACADNWVSGVLTNLPLPVACDEQGLLFLRWVMADNVSATNGIINPSSGANRIDDIIVRGTRSSVPAPQALPAGGVNASQFTANWLPVDDATGYQLDVAISTGFEPGEPGPVQMFDFEAVGETKTAYTSGVVSLGGVDWNLTEVLIGTTTNDWRNGVRSARLRGYGTSAMTMQEDLTNGLGHLAFQYRRYGTDGQEVWKAEYSTDGGVEWTQIGQAFTAPSTNEVQTFSNRVGVAGNARVRIRRVLETGSSDRRLNIDDIAMSSYAPGDFVPAYESRAVSGPGHVVEALTKGTYYYRVRAVDSEIVSGHSNVIRVRASDTAPGLLLFVH